ncbi:hypothetical protein SEUCBS140593_004895 [Sporothrix eucalyptigena]|uniref:NADH-ubiquinone oxidoreductase 17.8 kDa subunit n=1 Tax=Sporothrix eucalyptigena TaxID=1812306 RepID=A0ABP0BSM1_9PEZI
MARQARVRPAALTSTMPARRFASTESHGDHHDHHDHHDHGHAAPVEESFGTYGYIALGTIPFVYALYTLSRPGKDGEATALEAYLNKFSYLTTQSETRNSLHTAAVEQAAHDKNLLYNIERNTNVDLRYPEIFQSSSPYNVPAGHSANLDNVVAHYREQHHKEVARQQAAQAAREKQ